MAVLGNSRKAYIAPGSSGMPDVWLSGEQSNSVNRTAEAIEVSDKSSEWAQFIAGKKGTTIEVTVFTDDIDDGPQHEAINALHTGGYVRIFVGELDDQDAVVSGDLATGIITAISDTNDTGAVASRTLSITITDSVTHTAETPEEEEES
jgi:hypothetical protein